MRISKLEPSKHKKGRFLVHLEDGGLLRVGEGEVVSFGLYSGMELDPEVQDALAQSARQSGLRDYALNALTARPLSRRELTDKLQAREASPEEAREIANWLEGLGLLNDGEYAKSLARHYAAKGYGPYKIKDELFRRGVPKSCWEDALEELEPPEETIDALLRKKLSGPDPDRKELKRAADALARRGYAWSHISAALRRYGAEEE